MKSLLIWAIATLFVPIFQPLFSFEETDDIYWETAPYKLKPIPPKRYVYHLYRKNFIGHWIVPMNKMPEMEGFSEIYRQCVSRYHGREETLQWVILPFNCLWNDVIFLSPLHPHHHYEEYRKIGFSLPKVLFYKIPIEILEDKRVTVWKWLSYKKYSKSDPIHRSMESYCALDFSHYQELADLPEDAKEYYQICFDPEHPNISPKYGWYRVPHILCLDPIDISDERITLIDWSDPIEDYE